MPVRVQIPDHVYEGYGKFLGCRDAGPGITGFLAGYLAHLSGYRPEVALPVSGVVKPAIDYSADWAAHKLADDPDDATLVEAKRFLIARKGSEEAALEWVAEKKENGIKKIRPYLISWYRDNKDG